jgi:kinesin family protein 18/19
MDFGPQDADMEIEIEQLGVGARSMVDTSSVAGIEGDDSEEHIKKMWAGQSNILVAVRLRPLLKHDRCKRSIVRVLDDKVVVVLDPAKVNDEKDILRANRTREKRYAFDFVFEPECTQQKVYENTTKFLIHGVLDGYNATVFAYGNTGAGKVPWSVALPTPHVLVFAAADIHDDR